MWFLSKKALSLFFPETDHAMVFPSFYKLYVLLSVVSILTSRPVLGQEEYVGPVSQILSEVPIRLFTGGIVVLEARLEGRPDTLRFVMDTGSSGISLDSATAERLRLPIEPSNVRVRGVTGTRYVNFVYNQQLNLPGLSVDSLHFHISDYSTFENVYGEKIDGIIGHSLLSRYIVQLNYDSLKMYISSNGQFKYPKGGYLINAYISTLPVHRAGIKDHRRYDPLLLHDIGAGLCLMLSRDFAADSLYFKKRRRFRPKQASTIGGKLYMDLTISSYLRIGPYKFKNVPTIVFDDVHNITSYPYLGGLIGNDILRRFNVIYNYAQREIYIKPNSHFNEVFDYAYTGTELLYDNGHIVIGPITPGSPAAAAGLEEGDVVVAINHLFNGNFDLYRRELQKGNRRAALIISRNNTLHPIRLKVQSIKR